MNEIKWERFLKEEFSIDLPSLELKDELSPDIWLHENKMKPEIKEKLIKIAHDFLKDKKLDEAVSTFNTLMGKIKEALK